MTPPDDAPGPRAPPAAPGPRSEAPEARDLWRWEGTVRGRRFATTGLCLMVAKYALDAGVVRALTGQTWSLWDYFAPLATNHARLGRPLAVAMVLWTVPFVWVGVAMTVRRCRDASVNPLWAGLLFVPVVNYVLMVAMTLAPSALPREVGATAVPPRPAGALAWAAYLRAAASGALLALPLVYVLAQVAQRYTTSLFIGAPFVVGLAAGWQAAGEARLGRAQLLRLSLLTAGIAGGALLLFALEGLVCVLMVLPLSLPQVFMGAMLGQELRRQRGRPRQVLPALLLPVAGAWPGGPVGDVAPAPVATRVAIAAPPEVVWEHVVAFPELAAPRAWMLRFGGIAHPRRARIEGTGVGAVRHCEFDTGTFVEPITDWQPGVRLAFDVVEQPPSMREWSPYRHLHPPHVMGGFVSRAGAFDLAADGSGGTILTGTTWFQVALEPVAYWRRWADWCVHTIHLEVLEHVKALSEKAVDERAAAGHDPRWN